MLWAEKRFRKAFLDDRWSEAELAPIRRLLRSWVWKAFAWIVLVSMMTLLVTQKHSERAFLWYVLLLPTQLAGRLRAMVYPRPRQQTGLPAWREMKPVHSEHWGEGRV